LDFVHNIGTGGVNYDPLKENMVVSLLASTVNKFYPNLYSKIVAKKFVAFTVNTESGLNLVFKEGNHLIEIKEEEQKILITIGDDGKIYDINIKKINYSPKEANYRPISTQNHTILLTNKSDTYLVNNKYYFNNIGYCL
jgi:uncharacterized protein YuzE